MAIPLDGRLPYSFLVEFSDRFRARRALVTGATGFLGRNLCQALEALGAEVIGAALPDSLDTAVFPARVLPVDLSQDGSARHAIKASDPDLVFHLAGLVDTRQSPDLVLPTLTHNLLAAVNVMSALVGSHCQRVITIASAETPRPGSRPNSPYAASKQAMAAYAEMYASLFHLPLVVARPHMVYGPYQPLDKLIPYLIRCGLDRTPPRLSSGTRLCDPIYVEDCIRALLLMAIDDRAVGLTLDVGTGQGLTVAEIAARVLRLTGAEIRPMFGAIPDRAGDVPQIADVGPTEAALGWRPAWSLDTGLGETIEWIRTQGDRIGAGPSAAPGEVAK